MDKFDLLGLVDMVGMVDMVKMVDNMDMVNNMNIVESIYKVNMQETFGWLKLLVETSG